MGLYVGFVLAVLSGFLLPGVPYAGWICILLGYVVYRILLNMIVRQRTVRNAAQPFSAAQPVAPHCGRILVGDS